MRDLVQSTMTTHLTITNNRLNEVMKVLTVISTIFMPLSFVAGVYGMNFDFMPETKWVYGYPVVVLVMLTICGLLYRWFRKVRWL